MPARSFRVIPASPNYLLRYPDLREEPLPDVLRVFNGFEPGRGWMDLRPAMELWIENAYYRPGSSRRGLEGFLGTETARYKVLPNGHLQLRSVQSMKDRPSDQLPIQQLIQSWQMHYPYHRFYNEILFKRTGDSRGSVLLGSSTPEELHRLAPQLLSDPDSVCQGQSKHCTAFPEACSVSIEMEIVVNGTAKDVLWDSTLSDVAEKTRNLKLSRISNGRLVPVNLDTGDTKALRLPLLPGDHVSWN